MALQRGPVVYCLEGVDNDGKVRNLSLPKDAELTATFEKDLLRGVVVIRGEALAEARQGRPVGHDESASFKQCRTQRGTTALRAR